MSLEEKARELVSREEARQRTIRLAAASMPIDEYPDEFRELLFLLRKYDRPKQCIYRRLPDKRSARRRAVRRCEAFGLGWAFSYRDGDIREMLVVLDYGPLYYGDGRVECWHTHRLDPAHAGMSWDGLRPEDRLRDRIAVVRDVGKTVTSLRAADLLVDRRPGLTAVSIAELVISGRSSSFVTYLR